MINVNEDLVSFFTYRSNSRVNPLQMGSLRPRDHEDSPQSGFSGLPFWSYRFTRRRQVPKHTNLTGGGRAYLGGELWFTNNSEVYVSGGSGRYPPSDERQLWR